MSKFAFLCAYIIIYLFVYYRYIQRSKHIVRDIFCSLNNFIISIFIFLLIGSSVEGVNTFDFYLLSSDKIFFFILSVITSYFSLHYLVKSKVQFVFFVIILILLFIYNISISFYQIAESFFFVRLLLLVKFYYEGKRIEFLKVIYYIFYFPVFISGPFIKIENFISQQRKPYELTIYRRSKCMVLVAIGLFKVTILYPIFSTMHRIQLNLFLGNFDFHNFLIMCIAYYIFIYFSFSGISEISRGVSIIHGIYIERNFKSPLVSKNLQDHWSRWHISFMTLLMENIFFPISIYFYRKNMKYRHLGVILGIFFVFIFLYIWQGARGRFLIFSIWNFLGLSLVYIYGVFKEKRNISFFETEIYCIMSRFVTFIFIIFGYYLFSTNLTDQRHLLCRVLGGCNF